MKTLRFIAFAGVCATALSTQAAVLPPLDLSTGSAAFGNTPIAGSFTDTATFTLTTASFLNASVTTVVNGAQDVDFTSIVITGTGGPFSFSQLSGDPVEVWATPTAGFRLNAGTYTLTLTGTNSAAIGSYAGNIAVTAVPEPGTTALLAAGLAVVGLLSRRRAVH